MSVDGILQVCIWEFQYILSAVLKYMAYFILFPSSLVYRFINRIPLFLELAKKFRARGPCIVIINLVQYGAAVVQEGCMYHIVGLCWMRLHRISLQLYGLINSILATADRPVVDTIWGTKRSWVWQLEIAIFSVESSKDRSSLPSQWTVKVSLFSLDSSWSASHCCFLYFSQNLFTLDLLMLNSCG